MNAGKKFENDWKNSIPKDVWYYRFRDGTASFGGGQEGIRFQQTNVCDCEIYKRPDLFYLELKTHQGKSIPFKCIVDIAKKTQVEKVKQLMDAHNKGVKTYYIFNFRDVGETYAIPANFAVRYMEKAEGKSFPIAWCREVGLLIPQRQLKVNWRYDIGTLLTTFA